MDLSSRKPGPWIGCWILLFLCTCQTAADHQLAEERLADLRSPAVRDGHQALPEEPPPDLELQKADLALYVHYGLLNNAGLQAAFERWRAALHRIVVVRALPDPQFTYAWFVEPVETRTGPQRQRFSLSQQLPWFGKLRLRGDVAAREAEAKWLEVVAKRFALERDISIAFQEYGYLAQAIRITEDNLELLRQLDPVVQRRIQGGAGQQDLLRLQVEIGKLENEVESLLQLRPALSSRLAATLNWNSHQVLPLPELDEPTLAETGLPELREQMEQRNPDLLRLQELIARGEHARELAGLEKWPDFKLGLDYFQTDRARTSGVSGSGDDPVALSLSFNIPLWYDKYQAAEWEAERALEAARRDRQQKRFSLRAELDVESFELDDAGRQVRLYRDSLLPRARESLELARTSYRTGTNSLLDVIDSERLLLTFETAYWKACRDYWQSRARLVALCGGEEK